MFASPSRGPSLEQIGFNLCVQGALALDKLKFVLSKIQVVPEEINAALHVIDTDLSLKRFEAAAVVRSQAVPQPVPPVFPDPLYNSFLQVVVLHDEATNALNEFKVAVQKMKTEGQLHVPPSINAMLCMIKIVLDDMVNRALDQCREAKAKVMTEMK